MRRDHSVDISKGLAPFQLAQDSAEASYEMSSSVYVKFSIKTSTFLGTVLVVQRYSQQVV
jgi:hypothetical protein